MKKYFNFNAGFLALFAVVSLVACEPEQEQDEDLSEQWGDTTAVKSGKGFTEVAVILPDYLQSSKGSDQGASDDFYPVGLSRVGDVVHIATWQKLALPGQSEVAHFEQYTVDVNNGEWELIENENDDAFERHLFSYVDAGITPGYYGYQRGTSNMYQSVVSYDNWGNSHTSLNGDIEYYRYHSFARRARVANNGIIVEDGYCEHFAASGGGYNNRAIAAFKDLDDVEHQIVATQWIQNVDDAVVSACAVPLTDTSGHFILFTLSKDSLFVSDLNMHTYLGSLTHVVAHALPSEWAASSFKVRLSDDEGKIGFVFGQGDPYLICSGSYDIEGESLTLANEDLEIPNMSQLINHDIDTDGNFYFDNYGSNFTSTSTISIYKASGNNFTTVGSDDILDGGQVQWIQVIDSKVHAVVGYSITEATSGVTYHRCALIIEE